MKQELMAIQQLPFAEVLSMSEAFAGSGMFPDVTKAGQAMVKIIAGQEIGIPPFQAMNGIHIISGKTTLGAGIIASRVKGSGKYDYDVKQLDTKACVLIFKQGNKVLGESEFTIEDAKKAGTKNLEKYTKNMLFARAMSNGVKWYCPDVFAGPVYVPEDFDSTGDPILTEDTPHEEIKTYKPVSIGSAAFNSAVKAMKDGKTLEDVEASANTRDLTFDNIEIRDALLNAVETAA